MRKCQAYLQKKFVADKGESGLVGDWTEAALKCPPTVRVSIYRDDMLHDI